MIRFQCHAFVQFINFSIGLTLISAPKSFTENPSSFELKLIDNRVDWVLQKEILYGGGDIGYISKQVIPCLSN